MDLDEFLQAPRESLNIELKAWISPTTPEGKAKIVKAAIALRNLNGGYLGIGISDAGHPLTEYVPENLEEQFHHDTIQAIISKYSSEAFEISIKFGVFNGVNFPFIIIPAGVRSPVAAKLGILDPNNPAKELVKKDIVYVRTLAANLTPSTAPAQFSDWPQIMDVCFDNREADIGSFVRRHLSGLNIPGLLAQLNGELINPQNTTAAVDVFLNECYRKFIEAPKAEDAIRLGDGRFEVAFIINSTQERRKTKPDENFLSSFIYANPRINGWPLWMDSRGFSNPQHRPRTRSGGYEVLIEDYAGSLLFPHLDFWRAEPPGRFYHVRVLWEDVIAIKNGKPPNQSLAMDTAIRSVTEALLVGISFAKSMAFPENSTTLDFAFRWSGLIDRKLSSHEFFRYIPSGVVCGDDQVLTHISVPLEIASSSVPSLLPEIVSDLFSSFNGITFPDATIEKISLDTLKK